MTGRSALSGQPPPSVRRFETCVPTDGGCPHLGARADGGAHRAWRLPAVPSSLPPFRRQLDDVLGESALSGEECYDLLLATCEATSNAIEHAGSPHEPFVDVRSEISDGRVTIVVQDHGRWRDAPSGPHRGRGLAMMWLLAETTVTTCPAGTTVTIRSSPRHAAPAAPWRGEAAGSRR